MVRLAFARLGGCCPARLISGVSALSSGVVCNEEISSAFFRDPAASASAFFRAASASASRQSVFYL
ncbi:MAG: hypothetical protein LBG27_04940 [Spirochaetaceae bacterium]|nr:hypothetical protein [Spirochaetaceae bacterium]